MLDVPRDLFLVAGEAWSLCRSGVAIPSKFGLSFANLHGLWFVAEDLVRDLAALNKMEMLPWDVWGIQPTRDASLNDEHLEFFDKLIPLSCNPDASFDILRQLYTENSRLRVPSTVLNALLNRAEAVLAC